MKLNDVKYENENINTDDDKGSFVSTYSSIL